MLKLNKKGFSVLEAILLAVIVIIVCAVGWFVWQQRNVKQDATSSNTVNNSDAIEVEELARPSEETLATWKTYDGNSISLQYPGNWRIIDESKDEVWETHIVSPDFIEPRGEGPGPTAAAGYKLEVVVLGNSPAPGSKQQIADMDKAQGAHGGNYRIVKIDGRQAIVSNIKSHGTFIYATVYANGNEYIFRLHAVDENKPEVKTMFDNILSTVQIHS